MLSSCWFTTPFTGCFNGTAKGLGGGATDTAAGLDSTRVIQPAPTTRTQPAQLSNGTAGGGGGGHHDAPAGETAAVHQQHRQESNKQPPTPRKSKSMGRITGDHRAGGGDSDVVPAADAEMVVVVPGASTGLGIGGVYVQQQQTNITESGVDNASAAAESIPSAMQQEETQHTRRGFGHRRVPSDGVAWRRSKGLEADLNKAAMESSDGVLDNSTYKSEYRKKFRPFSQYQYVDGKFHIKQDESPTTGAPSNGEEGEQKTNAWYKEVLELRKQAGQYRHRGWGVEMASERLAEIYNQQAELWEQVSRRSSLQALSLASASPSSRPISKAEKEIVNSRRSSPIKHPASKERPSTAPPKPKPATTQRAGDKVDGKSSKESTPRHHYERTTGSGEDGLLITSPSRDNIEPTVVDWTNRRSSRKTPPATSPVKGRSVSVDPQSRSPKRSSRPPSTHAPPSSKPERRPRPTSLATSARRKGADTSGRPPLDDSKKPIRKGHDLNASPKKGDLKNRENLRRSSEEGEAKKDKEKEIILKDMEAVKEASLTGRKSTPEPRFDPEKFEPVVKTPPEPTRVKSPDQVMVKSPDPVNWTVPLDTGKTFTVTHNIPEGESSRATPSSEHRAPFESRPRQTPEPTKIYQGSLAGTPITTATAVTTAAAPDDSKPPTQVPAQADKTAPADKSAAVPSKFDAHAPASKTAAPEIKKEERTLPDIPELKPDEKLAEIESAKQTELPKSSVKEQPKMEPIPESMTSSILNDIPSSPLPAFHSSGAAQDPMNKSMAEDPMTMSMVQDPMTTSMIQDPMTMSMTQDPMTMSMTQDPMTMSMSQDAMKKSAAADPMTMSVFGTLNGTNGNKSSAEPSPTKPELPLVPDPPASKPATTEQPVGARAVPGTNMRCLDDPSFMFDQSKPTLGSSPPKEQSLTTPVPVRVLEAPSEPSVPPQKIGGYRVLEAPDSPPSTKASSDPPPTNLHENPVAVKPSPYRVLEAPLDEAPSIGKGSPYRVLEAPESAYYPPAAQPTGATMSDDSKPPALVSPSTGRTVTDALDKARSRFDSFWGGNKDKDPPSKV